jgi:hypothetical protein
VGGHQTGQSHFYLWTSYPTLGHHSLFGFSRGTLLANDKKKKKKEKEKDCLSLSHLQTRPL